MVEDPDGEFTGREPAEGAPAVGPRIINVGIPGPGSEVAMWRRSWRDKVCGWVLGYALMSVYSLLLCHTDW